MNKTLKKLIKLLIKIIIVAAAVFALFKWVVCVRIVHNNDMYPTFRDGDLVLISRLSTPILDQCCLYRDPSGIERLGRVVVYPGDEASVYEEGSFAVNGSIIYQTIPFKTTMGSLEYPYLVPDDHVFILNDYRELELDSRTYGAIPYDNIIGTVIFSFRHRGF